MAEWELTPFETVGDNTPQTYFKQIEQELASVESRRQYLLEERRRVIDEICRLGLENI